MSSDKFSDRLTERAVERDTITEQSSCNETAISTETREHGKTKYVRKATKATRKAVTST